MRDSTETARRLFEIANAQRGFFTAKQAKDVGYFEESLVYHVRAGNWIREHRGIYRLANYPLGERPDLMLWHLWSRNRDDKPLGVYSHETALSLHDLSDVNPNRLHMTVPKGFRRNSDIPEILELHFDDISPSDVQPMHGVAVSSPMRTILDVARAGTLSGDLLRQAVTEALERGMIAQHEIRKARADHDGLDRLMQGVAT